MILVVENFSAKNKVTIDEKIIAATIKTPPIVGVPCFFA